MLNTTQASLKSAEMFGGYDATAMKQCVEMVPRVQMFLG